MLGSLNAGPFLIVRGFGGPLYDNHNKDQNSTVHYLRPLYLVSLALETLRLKARGLSLEHVRDQVSDSRYGAWGSRLSTGTERFLWFLQNYGFHCLHATSCENLFKFRKRQNPSPRRPQKPETSHRYTPGLKASAASGAAAGLVSYLGVPTSPKNLQPHKESISIQQHAKASKPASPKQT